MDANSPQAVGAILDRMPVTAFHHRVALIIAAGLLIDGIDVYITAGVSGALLQSGVATLPQVGALAMWTTLGLIIGGALAGAFADRLGRLRLMWVTLAIVIVAGLLAAFAPNLQQLTAWRFVTAIGLGGDGILAYGLLTELAPAHMRGRWVAWVSFLGNLGLPLCLLMAHFVLPMENGWRIMIAIPAIAAIGVMLLRLLLVESPRWLAAVGREAEARSVMTRIEAQAPSTSQAVAPTASTATTTSANFWPRLAVAGSIHIATMAAVFGFVSWLPTFFATTGTIQDSTFFAGVMSAGAPVGTLFAFAITDRIERKWGVIAVGVCAALAGAIYALASTTALVLPLGFVTVALIYALATLGTFGYVPELFATRVRLRVIGVVITLGRLTALAMPIAVVPLFSAWGQKGVLTLVLAILIAQAAIVAALGPRTRGLPLDAI